MIKLPKGIYGHRVLRKNTIRDRQSSLLHAQQSKQSPFYGRQSQGGSSRNQSNTAMWALKEWVKEVDP